MRALQFHGNKDIRIDTIPEPDIRKGHVKVKVAWSGICGSGTCYTFRQQLNDSDLKRRPS